MSRRNGYVSAILAGTWMACSSMTASSFAEEAERDNVGGLWHNADCSQLDIDINPDNGLIDGLFRSTTFPRATVRVTGAVIPSRIAMPNDEGVACAVPGKALETLDPVAQKDCAPGQIRLPIDAYGRPVALAAKWLPVDAADQARQDFWRWSSLFSGQYFPSHIVRADQGGHVVPETLEVTIHMYFPDAELTPAQNFPARTLTFMRSPRPHCRPLSLRTRGEAGAFVPVQSGAFVYYGDMWIGDSNPEEFIFGHVTDSETGEIAIYYNDGKQAYSGRGYADVVATEAGNGPLPARSFVWTVSTAASAPNRSGRDSVRIKAAVGSIRRAPEGTRTAITVWEQTVTSTNWLKRGFSTRIGEGKKFFLHPR